MQTIGASEAKMHFSALLEDVQKGKHIIITKHGHPVAKLVPISGVGQVEVEQVIEAIKQFSHSHTLRSISWKKLRDEGRR